MGTRELSEPGVSGPEVVGDPVLLLVDPAGSGEGSCLVSELMGRE